MLRIASIFCLAFLVAGLAPARAAITTAAPRAVLMDAGTGTILFAKEADTPTQPGSIAKLMTLEVMFDALKKKTLSLDEMFSVSTRAWRTRGAGKMFVRVDTHVPIDALIQGIIVASGDDACITVAEGMSGSESAFAARMTQRAREIGLAKSNFVNATGQPDEGEAMTPREMALLARHLMTAYPEYYRYFGQRDFTWEKVNQRNRLLDLAFGTNIDGLKSGRDEKSGYGAVVSSARDSRRFILVVHGLASEKDAVSEAKRVLSAAFREFKLYDLVAQNQIVGTAPVFMGQAKEVGLSVDQPVERLMSREMRAKMKVYLDYTAPLTAPVKAGTKVGTLTVSVPGAAPTVVSVYTNTDVARAGLVGAMKTGLSHFFFGEMGDLPPPSTVRKKRTTGTS